MERKLKPSPTASFVLSLLFGLLAVYVAAYYLCVQPTSSSGTAWYEKFSPTIEAKHRYIGTSGQLLFAPVHAIDRTLRPDTWTRESREIERNLGVEYY